jgi:hypothetical protein
MSGKPTPATVVPKPLSPQVIERMVTLQEKELEIRARELESQHKESENNFKYAQSALDAHAHDRKDERDHQTRRRKGLYIIIGIIVTILFIFLFAAAYIGKESLAMEVVKLVGAFVCGGGGGYAIGKSNTPANGSNDQS